MQATQLGPLVECWILSEHINVIIWQRERGGVLLMVGWGLSVWAAHAA